VNVTYADCAMTQKSLKHCYPRGIFIGSNSIVGPANVTGSDNRGTLVINGRSFPRGRL
jgi:hypothetical protein